MAPNPLHTPRSIAIAVFVTPHGFGHAARAAGVMQALADRIPDCRFDIFTRTPEWFFKDSLAADYTYHGCDADVGMVQQSPLVSDLSATVRALQAFLPFSEKTLQDGARCLREKDCRLVICDIAPLGIAVAKAAGLPSVLIENFTWDWIYQGYLDEHPQLREIIEDLAAVFSSAGLHIQTEPICRREDAAAKAPPVSRRVFTPPDQVRRQLGIQPDQSMVLITMGGVPDAFTSHQSLMQRSDVVFVVSGSRSSAFRRNNLRLLPQRSAFFHPDLINAADVVVGKAGYSTIAEVYRAGVPFIHVSRTDTREAKALVDFIDNRLTGLAISAEEFYKGGWVHHLDRFLALPRVRPETPDGAAQIADMICKKFGFTDR